MKNTEIKVKENWEFMREREREREIRSFKLSMEIKIFLERMLIKNNGLVPNIRILC